MTASGFIDDIFLAPGNYHDVSILANYIDECVEMKRSVQGQTWVMDKGYISSFITEWAKTKLGLNLLARQKIKLAKNNFIVKP
jgi:hypothetical protein